MTLSVEIWLYQRRIVNSNFLIIDWCNYTFSFFLIYFTTLSLLTNTVVAPNPHYRGYTANSTPSPRYSRGVCPHSRGTTATIAPITAVNTAVTAVLPPSPSPCQSLVCNSPNQTTRSKTFLFPNCKPESEQTLKVKVTGHLVRICRPNVCSEQN